MEKDANLWKRIQIYGFFPQIHGKGFKCIGKDPNLSGDAAHPQEVAALDVVDLGCVCLDLGV